MLLLNRYWNKYARAFSLIAKFSAMMWLVALFLLISCNDTNKKKGENNSSINITEEKVVFMEFGANFCLQCRKMQEVINSMQEKYSEHIEIIFYNVLEPEGKKVANQYKIGAIPAQVFLDKKGNEFFRHTGYLSEEEVLEAIAEKTPELSTNKAN